LTLFLLGSVVWAAGDEVPAPTIVGVTATAHRSVCSRDVPWHCFDPAPGMMFAVVDADLTFAWSEQSAPFPVKDAVALVVDGSDVAPLASGESGLLYDLSASAFYRPYNWKRPEDVSPRTREWVFVVREGVTEATLRVGAATAAVTIPAPQADPPDPRRVATFEYRYARWHSPWQSKTQLEGTEITSRFALDCEVLEVGVSARALEGAARSYGGETWEVHTRDFGLAVPGVGVLRPLEELWNKPLPTAELKHTVKPGDSVDVELLFCFEQRPASAEVLYRNMPVAPVVFEGAAPAVAEVVEEPGLLDRIIAWLGL
jgi:hypothetical protein